jgi:hypothetical protein
MRRFAKYSGAVALIALLAGNASAASIILSTNSLVSPGVFRVDMVLNMNTPADNLLALQFDLDLDVLGKSLAATPNFTDANASRDDGTVSVQTPFDLSHTLADPSGAIDVRAVYAATDLFSVNSLIAQTSALPNCAPGATCAKQQAALAVGHIYLGSFNVSIPNGVLGGTGEGPAVQVLLPPGAIFGEADLQPQNGTDPLIQDLRNFATANGGRVTIAGVVPEPTSLALMALGLAALASRRRSA